MSYYGTHYSSFFVKVFTMSDISTEVVKPQFDSKVHTALTDAFNVLISNLSKKAEYFEEAERPITEYMKSLTKRQHQEIMRPIDDVIRSHLGIVITTWLFNYTSMFSVHVGFMIVDLPNPHLGTGRDPTQLKTEQQNLAARVLMRHISDLSIRPKGILTKDTHLTTRVILTTSIFDAIASKGFPVSQLVDIIIHELGHLRDWSEDFWRANTYSTISEEVVTYQQEHGTPQSARALLEDTLDLITTRQVKKKARQWFVAEAKAVLSSDTPITDVDKKNFISCALALVDVGNGIIAGALGKLSDIPMTKDHYKHTERRADRYSVMHGSDIANALRSAYGGVLPLYWATGAERETLLRVARSELISDPPVTNKYDNCLDRITRVAREQSAMFRSMDCSDPSFVREQIEKMQTTINALEVMKKDIGNPSFFRKAFDAIGKYGWRALTLPFMRGRFAQDDSIHDMLHDLSHSPLHYHAAVARHGVPDHD